MGNTKTGDARTRQSQRQVSAAQRQQDRAKRTDAQQVQTLERRGCGHCQEAIRLRERMKK